MRSPPPPPPDVPHVPVLRAEVLAALDPAEGKLFIDATLGAGGHSEAILRVPGTRVIGIDRDPSALAIAEERLEHFGPRFRAVKATFGEIASVVQDLALGPIHGILADVGVSSMQLDRAERGMSFRHDGPLDMRMDDRQSVTAETLVNELDAAALAKIFWEYGDEAQSRRMAARIVQARSARRIRTTGELAALIEQIAPRRGRRAHPATKVFQALRIAVNDELAGVRAGLAAALVLLKPGGRLAVISFQSLEDREVKKFGRERSAEFAWDAGAMRPDWSRPRRPELRVITPKAIKPGETELRDNPRSRSAQLRVFEKLELKS